MIPWQGTVDYCAESSRPGGIVVDGFLDFWYKNAILSSQYDPDGQYAEEQLRDNRVDFADFVASSPLRTDDLTQRPGDIEQVEIPFLSVSNFFSAGIHARCNFLAFHNVPSKHKWLEVHLGSHVSEYCKVEGRALQKQFLGHWLKDIDTGLMREPAAVTEFPSTCSTPRSRSPDARPPTHG